MANRQRRESPNQVNPLDWTDYVVSVRIEDVPHRRAAQLEYLKNLPGSTEERKVKLKYLETLAQQKVPDIETGRQDPFREGMNLINSVVHLLGDKEEEARVEKVLKAEKFDLTDSPISYFPDFIREMPPAERLRVWGEVKAFESTLRDPHGHQLDLTDIEYILAWIGGYANEVPHLRPRLYQFLTGTLKDGDQDLGLPVDPVARHEWIDFVRLWGRGPAAAERQGEPGLLPLAAPDRPDDHVGRPRRLPGRVPAVHGRPVDAGDVGDGVGPVPRVRPTVAGHPVRPGHDADDPDDVPDDRAERGGVLARRPAGGLASWPRRRPAGPWAEAILSGPAAVWLANFAIRMFRSTSASCTCPRAFRS